ncbi:tRNA uracil 4-sulfurtransferase ThiI [Infirmifilum uzonense]|uniref:tRNA uracil 4-sulfurtransferase ThiI n=1 Tax=Infirmifilum uzonense TaxID=1550241 RepID=UPI003C70EC21
MSLKKVVLIRLGELTIKGLATRKHFENLLKRNIMDALRRAGIEAELRKKFGRFYIYGPYESIDVLRRVFGIKSLSPAVEYEFKDLEDLIVTAEEYFKEKVLGKRFAVRTRRVGSHTFSSIDVNRLLGERLLKYASKVDLENPEVTAYVEVRGNKAYFFTEIIEAWGGLPVGSEGRVISLVSGGFDSIVASWLMLKRGAEVDFLYLNLGGPVSKCYVLRVVKTLADNWCYGYDPKLYIVDFTTVVHELKQKVKPELIGVVLKRLMYRVANRIALKTGAEGIVTGENLGQVSSQTLANLNVIDKSSDLIVLRPVIAYDKDEIVELARKIGTYEASSQVKEICGVYSFHPTTHARLDEVLEEEAKIDVSVLEKSLDNVEIIDLHSSSPIDAGCGTNFQELEVDEIPSNAVVLDVRPPEKYRSGRIPGSINVDIWSLEDYVTSLGKEKKYVVVCDEGGLSREAAFLLRKMGVDAYSLRGGLRRYWRAGVKRSASNPQEQASS